MRRFLLTAALVASCAHTGADEPQAGEAECDEEADEDCPPPPEESAFAQGRWRLAVRGGGGSVNQKRYFALGFGASFYVFDGLEVGIDLEQWIGEEPLISKISPQVRYVFHQLSPFSPYLGVFYRHWFIWTAQVDGFDTLGGRAGITWSTGFVGYVSGGVVYERVLGACGDTCDIVYPEIGLAFSL